MTNSIGTTPITILSGISAALLGWIGLVSTQQKNRSEDTARLAQVTLSRMGEDRQRQAGQRDVELKVYDAVVSALQDGSERRQSLSRSLVNAMVVDTVLQRGLLEALRLQGAPSVQAAAASDLAFDQVVQTTKATAARAPGAGVARIDLFWCETSGPSAKQTMETVRQNLGKDFPPAGIRVRQLPRSINTRPGYNVSGYQVRLETGEQNAADLVRKEIGSATGNSTEIALVPVGTRTPGYLSAFACP
jgi:hypothetical protein